jgi:hypothetical protein
MFEMPWMWIFIVFICMVVLLGVLYFIGVSPPPLAWWAIGFVVVDIISILVFKTVTLFSVGALIVYLYDFWTGKLKA